MLILYSFKIRKLSEEFLESRDAKTIGYLSYKTIQSKYICYYQIDIKKIYIIFTYFDLDSLP